MREKGKKRAKFQPTLRTARQLIGNIGPAPSDPLVGDQEVRQEDAQTDGSASIFKIL